MSTMKTTDNSKGLFIEDLSVYIGSKSIVSAVNIDIGPNEIMVIVGPSGSGKTTLLRAIAGLVPARTGHITIHGNEITHLQSSRRNVGMVFQDFALYPYLSVYGNIEFPLRIKGIDRGTRRQKVREIAASLNISEMLDRRVDELSGGERQRVALGRALIRRPDVFLFDEPMSNVDAALQDELRMLILKTCALIGVPALYVTHNQTEAWRIADQIGVMERGTLVQVGSPMELYEYPKSEFIARFISDVPMSIFPIGSIPECDRHLLLKKWPMASTIGVRLEDMSVFSDSLCLSIDDDERLVIPTNIQHIERLGRDFVAITIIGGRQVRALLPSDLPVSINSDVTLACHVSCLYLFDGDGRLVKPRGFDSPKRGE